MSPDAPAIVLAHSPLVGPASWGALPDVLRDQGREVVVVDVSDDSEPPFAQRYVARAATQVRDAVGARATVLVGHSGAGYLLPLLGSARRALRSPVAAYVFCDAGVPPARPTDRLGLLRTETADDETFDVDAFERHLRDGGRYPEWSDPDLAGLVTDDASRRALVDGVRPRGLDFWTEPVPVAPDWPDAPCGYLRLSPGYDRPARTARARGWPVVSADPPGGHFATCAQPEQVAGLLGEVLAEV
jgi:hypothetical protein